MCTCAAAFMLPAARVHATTLYATVYGNQKYIVGSSTLHSGLFTSRDTGRTWIQLGPRNLKAYRMDAVDSSRGRILFIAAGNGVHRSTDYGNTWRITTTWQVREVLDVKVDQRNPRFVYAATAFGFWRSVNGGESWEQPAGILKEHYLYRFDEIHRSGELLVAGHDAIYRTQNGGTTWVKLAASKRAMKSTGPLRGIVRLDAAEAQGSIVLQSPCVAAGAGRAALTFRCGTGTMLSDSCLYDVAFGPSGTPYIASNKRVYVLERSNLATRRGTEHDPRELPSPDEHAVHALAFVGPTLFAGSYGGGIFRFENGTWTLSGCGGAQIWSLRAKNW